MFLPSLLSSDTLRSKASHSGFVSGARPLRWARVSTEMYVAAAIPRAAARSRNNN